MALSIQTTPQHSPTFLAVSRFGLILFSTIYNGLHSASLIYRRYRFCQELMNLPASVREDIGIAHLTKAEINQMISKSK